MVLSKKSQLRENEKSGRKKGAGKSNGKKAEKSGAEELIPMGEEAALKKF